MGGSAEEEGGAVAGLVGVVGEGRVTPCCGCSDLVGALSEAPSSEGGVCIGTGGA